MKPENLNTKIFLDSGDPAETKLVLEKLGFLDGQTTNPSLFAKNPEVQARITSGNKYSKGEVYEVYKSIVQEVSGLLPNGSVSIEVYADTNTPVEEILSQAREMNTWIPNAHIKLPVTKTGLEAAEILAKEGMRLNMTLVFSQEQAAAVYSATFRANKGQIYLSPFIGRLDDRGEDGMSFIKNVLEMHKAGDGHVEVLSASVRTYSHFMQCLKLNCDIATVPAKVLLEWAEKGCEMSEENWQYDKGELKTLEYEQVDLNKNWREYNIQHDLTDQGLEKFAKDWNNLVQ
ncbi:MAG TPA: transaldolase [Candidatus Magasanikbacteria bacterium]|nr:transaldolase [Candidatus Magasanikbacteria bacterium]